jgi:hypothetical protein
MFRKLAVQITERSVVNVYTDITCSIDDRLVIETKGGLVMAQVVDISEPIDYNPFERGNAKCHVVENSTRKIYQTNKEDLIMFANQKTVEVKHISSGRVGIFYTDMNLRVGDVVVYERTQIDKNTAREISDKDMDNQWSVGIITNADPDCVTAQTWVIDVVDTSRHEQRKAAAKELKKIKAKLDQKKKQFQDMELLRLIAQSDPETAQLLETYNNVLNGGM